MAREEGINLHERRDNDAAQSSVSDHSSVPNSETRNREKLLDDLLNESKIFSSAEQQANNNNRNNNNGNNNMLPQYNLHQENERKRQKPNSEVTIEDILNIFQPPKPRQRRNNDNDGCTIS